MASDVSALATLPSKPASARIIVIGRLTPAKFVEEAVRAFAVVAAERPDAELDVVGSGNSGYRKRLETLVSELGLRRVTFHGRVSQERKAELLERSGLHVFASHREGWGLTVTEAGARGTPSVGYDAPGVRDSIGSDDLLAPVGDAEALGRAALRLLSDPVAYDDARQRSWNYARSLSYDRTADAFEDALRAASVRH